MGHPATAAHDVVIVGAGFGGLALAHALKQDGIDDLVILERGDGVGGTWRHNTYPGAACDVPSHLYSLSFAPNPEWSRAYAGQPEILRYAEDCYDRLDVRRHVQVGVTVTAATWDEGRSSWTLHDSDGRTYEARTVVFAIGTFHTPAHPGIAGLADFAGPVLHSARWDADVDLDGRSVAVIGTGASAIQLVPAIAGRVGHLDLYQRTAAWILPRKDDPYSDEQRRAFAEHPELAQAHRTELHDRFEQATTFLTGDPTAAAVEQMALGYLAHAVADPDLRARLTPDHAFGCKRVLISSDYYPAVQRENVELVTTSIERVTEKGVRTVDGTERPADVLVLCTGFRAAEYLHGIRITGRGGADLHERWAGTPRAFHGLAVPGFPNLFQMYGPNTNQGGNSILLILEAQASFIAGAVRALADGRAEALDVRPEAMDRYVEELEAALATTVWSGCDSYFRNASGAIVTQLPHTSGWYRAQTSTFPIEDFRS